MSRAEQIVRNAMSLRLAVASLLAAALVGVFTWIWLGIVVGLLVWVVRVLDPRTVVACPYCGKGVKLGFTTCHHCGRQLASSREQP